MTLRDASLPRLDRRCLVDRGQRAHRGRSTRDGGTRESTAGDCLNLREGSKALDGNLMRQSEHV